MSTPVMLLMFVGLAGLGLVVVGLRSGRRRGGADEIMERMGRYATREEFLTITDSAGNRHEPHKVAKTIEQMVEGGSIAERMSGLLARADVKMTVGELLTIRIAAALGGFAVGFLLLSRFQPALGLLMGVACALIGYAVPYLWLTITAKRRMKKFIAQLGDTITLMANSLRAGYSLLQTMELVSRESPDPMATEFRRVVREVGLGVSTQEAMQNLLRRVPSDDLDLMVTAINIQHEVGGNLAQILTIIGHTIRERVRIKGEVAVLTAQQAISGYVITALPVFLSGVIFMLNPDYMLELMVWPWVCMPIAAVIMLVIGFFVMKKITNIEV